MRVTLYCRCGGLWVGTAWTQEAARRLESWFRAVHFGPACGWSDAGRCRKARSDRGLLATDVQPRRVF